MTGASRRINFAVAGASIAVTAALSFLMFLNWEQILYEDVGSVEVYMGGLSTGSYAFGIVHSLESGQPLSTTDKERLEAMAQERGVGFHGRLLRRRTSWWPGDEIKVTILGEREWERVEDPVVLPVTTSEQGTPQG